MTDRYVDDPLDGLGEVGDAFDPDDLDALYPAAQAMRQVITAEVIHKDHRQVQALVAEHLAEHQRYLIYAAASFVAHHLTHQVTEEFAADRFHYLLTRLGNLVQLAADDEGEDYDEVLLDFCDALEGIDFGDRREAARAAQTCMVAHAFVRRGRAPWGIQRSLDRAHMLVVNSVLAEVIVMLATSFPKHMWQDVVLSLLGEAEFILGRQARAAGMPVSDLIEVYFVSLAVRECAPLE